MDAAKTFDGEVKTSGTIRIENRTTGKYTLVGCIYDKEGTMRDYVSVSFGYVAKDDEKPVILTMGLEATQEFAGQGITPDNSAKFYAFGEGIESVVYGLFRTDRLRGTDPDELLDAQGIQFTAGQLTALNAGHFSTMFTGLNGDSDYTLLLRAGNGYIRKTMQATYRTTGTYNPALDSFTYADFLPALDQPSLNDLTATTWNYYAVNYADNTEHPIRRKIGQVTMETNSQQSSAELQVLNINGLSGIKFDEGGALLGMYIPNAGSLSGFNGRTGALRQRRPDPGHLRRPKGTARIHRGREQRSHLFRRLHVHGSRSRRIPLLRTVAPGPGAESHIQLLLHGRFHRLDSVQPDGRNDARRPGEGPRRNFGRGIGAHRSPAQAGPRSFHAAELRRAARIQHPGRPHPGGRTRPADQPRHDADACFGSGREAGRCPGLRRTDGSRPPLRRTRSGTWEYGCLKNR